jgi:hypothetical protein
VKPALRCSTAAWTNSASAFRRTAAGTLPVSAMATGLAGIVAKTVRTASADTAFKLSEDGIFKRSLSFPMVPRTRPSPHACRSLKVAQDC